jgi:hypothetical protein
MLDMPAFLARPGFIYFLRVGLICYTKYMGLTTFHSGVSRAPLQSYSATSAITPAQKMVCLVD